MFHKEASLCSLLYELEAIRHSSLLFAGDSWKSATHTLVSHNVPSALLLYYIANISAPFLQIHGIYIV